MGSFSQFLQWFGQLTLADQIGLAILLLTGLLVVFGLLAWRFPLEPISRRREKSSSLYLINPQILPEASFVAGYNQTRIHLEIPEDQKILDLLRKRQDILIVGRPGIGKSHAAIRAFKRLQTWREIFSPWVVIIPNKEAVHDQQEFRLRKRRYIIFLDDINEYIDEIEGGERLFDVIGKIRRSAKEAVVVATLRSTRPEMDTLLRDAKATSHFKQIRLPDWPITRGQILSESSGLSMDAWDGTPLSIKQPSPRMELLYKQATTDEKSLFRELSYLWSLRIKFASRKMAFDLYSTGLFGSNTNFDTAVSLLNDKGFLRSATDPITPYEAYLSVIGDWYPREGIYESVVNLLAVQARTSDLLSIAGKHFADQDMDAAAKIYELCTSVDPSVEHAFYRLGVVRARQRKWEESKNAFKTAASISPSWSTAWFRLSNAYTKLGQPAEAKQAFLRGRAAILDESPEADAIATRHKHYMAARALRDENDFAGAAGEFEAAVKADPKFAIGWSYLGGVLRQLGRLPEAIDACQKAVVLDPDSPDIHLGLGIALQEKGDFERAETEFRAAIDADSEFAIGWSYLGDVLRELKKLPEARTAYDAAAKVGAITPEILFGIGRVLQDEGDFVAAETKFREACDSNPQFAEAWAFLGRAFRAQGRLSEAIGAYRRSIELNPAPESLVGLGLALRDANDLAGAEAQFDAATIADHRFALAWTFLANVRNKQRKFELALEADEKAVNLEPNNPNFQFGYGCAAMTVGKLDAAKTAFERVIALNPKHPLAHRRLETVMRRLSQTDVQLS